MGQQHDREQQGASRGPRQRRKFSGEFKSDTVGVVVTIGAAIAQVVEEFGLYDSTLGNWGVTNAERGPYVGAACEHGAVQEMKDSRLFGGAIHRLVNHRRLHSSSGDVPTAEYYAAHYHAVGQLSLPAPQLAEPP